MTDYRKMADEANAQLEATAVIDATNADHAQKMVAVNSLILVLESGLKIANGFMAGDREPYPGAAANVVKTSLRAVDLARAAGLIGDRPRKPQ